ncbi:MULTISPECIES: PTS sugar transporter subunit IIA [unclassified Sphingomonas]|uniref:PTS sugar transporter subunit IIA n=1 Tax=unclassified Sphingomonas TaxID=196159 RepID=UPI0006FD405C|nr:MULTISPECIES: PTS sugar transporter subunit IIA [unclassified Sphingomonas]KQM62033.1 PTS lactose transporter subunit IIC [Sphingomonas sp. Leaf16]KQN13433.1 PTS lactose transporter subunit IIC [Sphingomonas sp. Leaf29]KQN23331.1 PTS lactose transporter subunit IIC [Sphingomonas sp. Leaf32]
MYDFHDLVTSETVLAEVSASTRKALFAHIASVAHGAAGVDPKLVADRMADREKLGTTAFGGGIAIPHARIDSSRGVFGIFVRLDRPIDFGAIDELPVDLIFALLSPPDAGSDHLKALARVSRALRDAAFRAKLRGAGSADALYALLSGVEARDAA